MRAAQSADARAELADTHDAEHVYARIQKQGKPELKFPERSLKNARYDKKGGFQMGRNRIERTLTVNTVKTFAQTLKLMSFRTGSGWPS